MAPLVLPPTVLGFYLLSAMGANASLGKAWGAMFGHPLAFSFEGLVAASVLINLPFAVQPMQRAFEALPPDVREAAWVSGLSPWRTFWRIEAPLAWPGVLSAFALTFTHTLGEFGVVLMVGGSIPGETRTIALAIYDRVQAFDTHGAGLMSALLLAFSIGAIAIARCTMVCKSPRSDGSTAARSGRPASRIRWIARAAGNVDTSIGGRPANSSNNITPSAYTSLRVSTTSPSRSSCSGLMYGSVPITCPDTVSRVAASGSMSDARPKSTTLGTSSSPTSTFPGLRSR